MQPSAPRRRVDASLVAMGIVLTIALVFVAIHII
jgi:hypothetical protein